MPNNATRIIHVLERAQNSKGKLLRQMWAEAFGVSPENEEVLLRAFSDFLSLLERTKQEIKSIPNLDYNLYLDSFRAIEELTKIDGFAGGAEQTQRRIRDTATLLGLRFCAAELDKHYSERDVTKDKLDDLRSKIESIISELVRDSDLSPDVRMTILLHLENVRYSIVSFAINGTEGLASSVDQVVGGIARHQDKYQEAKQEKPDVLNRIGEVLEDAEDIIETAGRVKRLAIRASRIFDSARTLISSGG